MLVSRPPLTDTHAHVFEPGLPVVPGARYSPDYAATVDRYVDTLSAHGFDRGVLVQPSFLGSHNDYLLAALDSSPDRFRGVIMVDQTKLDRELADDRVSSLTRRGVRGVRLNLIGLTVPDLSTPRWQRAAATMAEHDWHLEIQASRDQWLLLESGIRSWPGRIVIDHLGLPQSDHEESRRLILALAANGHVWIKVSGPYRSPLDQSARMLHALVDQGASSRLVFGSDWPHTQAEDNTFTRCLEWATGLVEQQLLQEMLTTNADRLFSWDRPIGIRTPDA